MGGFSYTCSTCHQIISRCRGILPEPQGGFRPKIIHNRSTSKETEGGPNVKGKEGINYFMGFFKTLAHVQSHIQHFELCNPIYPSVGDPLKRRPMLPIPVNAELTSLLASVNGGDV